LDNGEVFVKERGYRHEECVLVRGALQKHLKTLIKYEFPRSRKLRMYQVEGAAELEMIRKKL
jgi:hypothetical protein